MKHIVVLDGATINPGDLTWFSLQSFGSYTIHEATTPSTLLERAQNAHVLIVNKVVLDKDVLAQLPQLELICVTATGYNNIDVAEAKKRNITVCNVSGYSTPSVAQHVFAFILHFSNAVSLHSNSVHKGEWFDKPNFSYWLQDIIELRGKKLGIFGYGAIGQEVARLGRAFGMEILIYTKTFSKHNIPDHEVRDMNRLFQEADFLTLHAALGPTNVGRVGRHTLRAMKRTAYLINTSRGGLIQEDSLYLALENEWIAGAGLDVLSLEPPEKDNPLIGAKNCIITPHLAWSSKASRKRLLDGTIDNIKQYLEGQPTNVVS